MPASRPLWHTRALFLLAALVALLLIVSLVGKIWIAAYLRGEAFRQFVGAKTGETLRGSAEFTAFRLAGSNLYSNGMTARGTSASAFSEMQLDDVRAEVSARRFFERAWQIEQLEIGRARVRFDGARIDAEPRSHEPAPAAPAAGGFLPNRVEIGSATVQALELAWSGGSLDGVTLDATAQDGGWNIAGSGGSLRHGALPPLEVGALKLRFRTPSLFIQTAEFRQGPTGRVSLAGEVRTGDAIDVRAQLGGIDVKPLLSPDWRVRLQGNLNGEVRVQSPLPTRGAPLLTGTMTLAGGQLEALPVLDEIAVFTRTAQFRRLALSRASGDFRDDGTRLSVSHFVAESDGLIRVEGAFTVEGAEIAGDFQVGVTAGSLQWLPGSQGRVFTNARGGYLWAPMHLAGPLAQPREDLSPRLLAAAKDAVIEGAQGTVRDATKSVQEAAKGALELLLGR